ncbi:hypothetical protein N0V88_006513 [Collariella sp. IMI 366227]|nr:hypothetical protein N0V88_006513 [Collariella sp. IMI 366227]
MSAPYWGQLPPPKASQTRARRLSDAMDHLPDRRQSLDVPPQGPSRHNRVSVQTTKSDAPTDSTLSPYASPTSSSFQGQGLTPRPPSFPYGTDQYPPELLENRRRRRSNSQDQDTRYAALAAPAPPSAPEAPRAPPSNYQYPPPGGPQPYPYPNPPQAIDRPTRQMAAEEVPPVLDRTRKTLDESAMPRPQRVVTDPTIGRNSPGPIGQRRASAAEQSLRGRVRRGSTHRSTDRPKVSADDRSPLQKLESTLNSISKEDKRARVQAAERAARERAPGQQGEKSPQQVRFRERRPSVSAGDAPKGLNHPYEVRSSPESRIPVPVQPPANLPVQPPANFSVQPPANPPAQASGIPQRNLSFRERAARNDVPQPTLESPATKEVPAAAPLGRTPPRGAGNKLKKPPPEWPNRISETDEIFNAGEAVPRSLKQAAAPVTPVVPKSAHPPDQPRFVPPTPEVLDDVFDDDYLPYSRPAKLQKTPSQRKADQILGRVPTQTANPQAAVPRSAAAHAAAQAVAPVVPTSAPPAYSGPAYPVATAGGPLVPHGDHQDYISSSGQRHHVSDIVYHARGKYQPGEGVFKPTPYLDEWKKATVGALSGGLLDLDDAPPAAEKSTPDKNTPWWEGQQSRRRSNSMSSRPKKAEAFEGEYDETNGRRSPAKHVIYPSIGEIQNGDLHLLSSSDIGGGLPYEPQHLSPTRAKARAKRWDGLRPFSPSPSASDSQDSLGCFSLCSNDATFSGQALTYSSPTRFKPPLYLKCGPLLRFCGIRHERALSRSTRNGPVADREIWRGSIMIVTTDADSSYDIAPTLRLFVQPIELLPPPPREIQGDEPLAPEYVDPIAGHPKLGRKGETLYVRPVDHLEEAKDVSRDESDEGLFEKTRSPPEVPLPEGVTESPGSFAARRKRAEMDGEKAGKYKDIRGFRLHAERGYTFWRFNIEVELRDKQQRIAYRINRGPSTGFWVPARGQSMNIMFHSCNGFSLSADSNKFTGPDPMWRDVLNTHQSQPFHVMIGGGDQIYNDRVMQETELFKDWLWIKNPLHKHKAPLTPEMQDELEMFYLERYAMWFSQGLFGMANSQIPMVNMWDDHDIIDGFGSYPHHFMNSPVFSGLGNIAFKYYMLFQHQSITAETEKTEPSWILGAKPGPYINEQSRSMFMFLGGKIALLAVDARTERTREEVVREDTWKHIMDRCYGEIDKGKVEHLLVLLGVPIAYPRMVWLENILTSRAMDPVKALAKLGMFGGLLNRFDGGVEVLDDLDDHWTAKNHKSERAIVIEDLQDLAADKSIRVTILSGDVHLAAVGQFYSHPRLALPKHKDFRYMPNVISSAIANTPPPDLLADVLNKRNKVHHFDKETDEDMIPLFAHGVDGKPRNNKHLLPHRNWCAIREYVPGSTPLPTPSQSGLDLASGEPRKSGLFRRLSLSRSRTDAGYGGAKDRTRPPVSGGLFRRLSGRAGPAASADEVGRSAGSAAGSRPGFLTRTLSTSAVGSAGAGGEKTDEEEGWQSQGQGPYGQQQQPSQHPYGQQQQYRHPPQPQQQQYDMRSDPRYNPHQYQIHPQQYQSGPRGGGTVGMRGGLGPNERYSNDEFGHDDETYFSVRPHSHQQPDPRPPVPPKLPMPAGGANLPNPVPGQPYRPQGQQPYDINNDPSSTSFHRTPTTLSTKHRNPHHHQQHAVDLAGALEVTLNVEISPKDPGGSTVPYRLVVPRLWYEFEGEGEEFPSPDDGVIVPQDYKKKKGGLKRLISLRRKG